MTFLYPEYLKLLLLLLILLPASLYRLRSRFRARRRLGGEKLGLVSHPSGRLAETLKLAASFSAMACLALALARPQIMVEKRMPELRKMDVVFLLDVSPSMRAQDIKPSRLLRAMRVISEFIEKKLPEDRFGLVSFSESSVILSYLTSDPNNIIFYLDYLREARELVLGTNIGGALKSALTVIARHMELEPEGGRNKKVFILISDGEDHGEELESALRAVAKAGIRTYAIGIGSRQGALIPIAEERGRIKYLEDDNGNPITSTFDEATLRRVASETGGRYYRAFTGEELEHIFAEIFLKERDIQGFKRVSQPLELYRHLLLAAFGFFVLRISI